VDGHISEIGFGFRHIVSGQIKGAKDVHRSKRRRKEKPEMKKKRKKEKSRGRRKGVWNLDGSKISDVLRHTQWNRTKISGVLFMQQGRKICAHSSAEWVAISA
jgi:hypothetical protein